MDRRENFRMTTARLYWQLPTEDGYVDFGNVTEYKDEPQIDRANHMQGKKGFRRLDFSLVKSAKTKKSLSLDERFNEVMQLLTVGTRVADIVQNAAPAVRHIVMQADLVAGRTYDMGALGLTNYNIAKYVSFSADPEDFMTLPMADAEWSLHPGSGMLVLNGPFTVTIPEGPHTGEIWPVYQVELIADQPAITRMNFKAFSNLLALGSFKLVEFDQFSQVPINIENFSGQVYVTAWGDNKQDFNEFTIEVLHDNSTRKARFT